MIVDDMRNNKKNKTTIRHCETQLTIKILDGAYESNECIK